MPVFAVVPHVPQQGSPATPEILSVMKKLSPSVSDTGGPGSASIGTELTLFARSDVIAHATYSFHDATFVDFVQDFGGVPTQLAGKRLEMSARNLAAFGIAYTPVRGLLANFEMNYMGSRYLNKRNTAPANGFASAGMGLGYRTPRWELRVDARNLGDRRDPVAESEFGDAQYYLFPSRRVDATLKVRF